jgi:hypothetical protein
LGFYVIDVADLNEALDVAREPAAANPGGTHEIRPAALYGRTGCQAISTSSVPEARFCSNLAARTRPAWHSTGRSRLPQRRRKRRIFVSTWTV